jgi:hypothetical protein
MTLALGALVFVPGVLQLRRHVALTRSAVICCPALGRATVIAFAEITAVRRTAIRMFASIRPVSVDAIELTLADGARELVPLWFSKRKQEEFLAQLALVVAAKIE